MPDVLRDARQTPLPDCASMPPLRLTPKAATLNSGSKAVRARSRKALTMTIAHDDSNQLLLLHVSDAHFGMPDDKKEMARITDGLITSAHQQPWVPDVCIFSGDLAYSGLSAEFDQGIDWLLRLCEKWPKVKLFIVPGNHDIDRTKAPLLLREVQENETKYATARSRFRERCEHFQSFQEAHSRLKNSLGDRCISNWSDPFGCIHTFDHMGRPIRFIGVNTALVSCKDDDELSLIADISSLNNFLTDRNNLAECVIAAGHHPLSWLVEWNRSEVSRILNQITGAHIYLHGHLHEQNSMSRSNARGENLTVLECGAAYQGSKWPQYFSAYCLSFSERQLETSVFALSPSSGLWVKSEERSYTITLPPYLSMAIKPTPPVKAAVTANESIVHQSIEITNFGGKEMILEETEVISIVSDSDVDSGRNISDDEVELMARRLIERATPIYNVVLNILEWRPARDIQVYRLEHRIKKLDSIRRKVKSRISAGDISYSVDSIEDVCGFRFVTLYQNDIPLLIDEIIARLLSYRDAVTFSDEIRIVVHTSRPETDPLSIRPMMQALPKKLSPRCSLKFESKPTGYSSVHVIVDCILEGGYRQRLPIEFQFRSGLEEFWGQLDHKLRYGIKRGVVGDSAWERHLNVLKAQFDAMIQYVDLIRESAEPDSAKPFIAASGGTPESELSILRPDAQLKALSGLPDNIYEQVSNAFRMWVEADSSRQFGGNPNKYREAADAFLPFQDGCPGEIEDETKSKLLAHTAKMERAYMLIGTGDPDCLDRAELIYGSILEASPSDATALLRMGQLKLKKKQFSEAIEFLDKAIAATAVGPKGAGTDEVARINDFSKMNKAYVSYRIFEDGNISEKQRKDALRSAIKLALEVCENGRNVRARRQALNDLVYYAWAERRLLGESFNERSLSQSEYRKYGERLIDEYETAPDTSFRVYDTLCRIAVDLSETEKSLKFAEKVCFLLEQAARVRGGGVIDGPRFGPRWAARVVSKLIDEDERDSLAYALERIEQQRPLVPFGRA